MNVNYIAQPNSQLGVVLSEMLDSNPLASSVIFVSAFVSMQTLMRVKDQVVILKNAHKAVRFVFGIDLGGTSQEVLQEVLSWDIDVRIVKHRIPGHTFHPKLYLIKWQDHASIIIGSNNFTEGGFFGNYESAACITYALPEEASVFNNACEQLKRFLEPDNLVTYELTADFLKKLIEEERIPTEAEARANRNHSHGGKRKTLGSGEPIFGYEEFPVPPPLSAELLERLIKNVRKQRKISKKEATKRKEQSKSTNAILPIDDESSDPLMPAAFYMTLHRLQGENIPGEVRIPIQAIELAKEFWGWPDKYTKDIPKKRVYWNWKPVWSVWSVTASNEITTNEVRMYMYENSSDFRFYARALVNAGGDIGDVVRIRRIAKPDAEFECVLARCGTSVYNEWIESCTQSVTNSSRKFGYA